jgi:hypothetical protein
MYGCQSTFGKHSLIWITQFGMIFRFASWVCHMILYPLVWLWISSDITCHSRLHDGIGNHGFLYIFFNGCFSRVLGLVDQGHHDCLLFSAMTRGPGDRGNASTNDDRIRHRIWCCFDNFFFLLFPTPVSEGFWNVTTCDPLSLCHIVSWQRCPIKSLCSFRTKN